MGLFRLKRLLRALEDNIARYESKHGEIKLTVLLTGSLSLFTGYNLEHDTRPPEVVAETDWNTKTGFAFNF